MHSPSRSRSSPLAPDSPIPPQHLPRVPRPRPARAHLALAPDPAPQHRQVHPPTTVRSACQARSPASPPRPLSRLSSPENATTCRAGVRELALCDTNGIFSFCCFLCCRTIGLSLRGSPPGSLGPVGLCPWMLGIYHIYARLTTAVVSKICLTLLTFAGMTCEFDVNAMISQAHASVPSYINNLGQEPSVLVD